MMSQTFELSLPQPLSLALQTDAEQRYAQELKILAKSLSDKSRYWMVDGGKLIYDSKTRCLWDGEPKKDNYFDEKYSADQYKTGLLHRQLPTLGEFRLPSKSELMEVAKNNFPLREGDNYRLKNCYAWLVQGGRIDLDNLSSG